MPMSRSFKLTIKNVAADIELEGSQIIVSIQSPMLGFLKWQIPDCTIIEKAARQLPEDIVSDLMQQFGNVLCTMLITLKGTLYVPSLMSALAALQINTIKEMQQLIAQTEQKNLGKNSKN
jgi:hypothetical protein